MAIAGIVVGCVGLPIFLALAVVALLAVYDSLMSQAAAF
jgi:hypothetical protein